MQKFLSVIDGNGNSVEIVEADTVHKRGMLHRAVHILVLNNKHKIFIRKRAKTKKLYPSLLSSSVGAHILAGQTANQAAEVNLKSYLGLSIPIKMLGEMKIHDTIENELVTFYIAKANKIPNLNPAESAEGFFMNVADIQRAINQEKTTPHLASAIKLYVTRFDQEE